MPQNANGASVARPPTPDTTTLLRWNSNDRFPGSLPGTVLSGRDYESLERAGISRSSAERALLRRVDSFTGAQLVGRNGNADYAGIVFPYIWPGQQHVREYRLRRDRPEIEKGKPKNKYISPPGRGNMLYFVPGTQPEWLENPDIPIMLTEGEKKTLALSELAWCAGGDAAETSAWLSVGISGVSNWHGKIGKTEGPNPGERLNEVGPISDLDRIVCTRRTFTVAFDSNVHTNEKVRIARFALAKELRRRGARVLFLDIPTNAGVNGIDDLIGLWGKDRVLDLIRDGAYDPLCRRDYWPFSTTDDGVFWLKQSGDEIPQPIRLSARIDVIAKTEDITGTNCGRLLRWTDERGRRHEWAMPMGLLASDGTAVREHLMSEGLYLATNRTLREKLAEYLQTAPVNETRVYASRIGWHQNTYVLPHHSVAPNGAETLYYQSPPDAEHHWGVSGTTEDWCMQLGALCRGNSRLLLAVSCAFAGPVLALLGAESGGLHFLGGSSSGKSTAIKVAASICGAPEFVQSWKNTKNGLEGMAVAHNDATLFLDELHQLDAGDAGEIAYDLANGQGRGRMSRSIAVRPRLRWRLLFLSSGEISLSEHAASVGTKTKGGVDVRLLNIPSDAGTGTGVFEDLHGRSSAGVFADELCNRTQSYYGAPFLAFLRKLIANRAESERAIRAVHRKFLQCLPADAVGEVKRAAGRFALLAAAGELATRFGLTAWEKGEAFNAAGRCYQDWLTQRETTGPVDLYNAVRQVRVFLERHGSSRFQPLPGRPGEDEIVVRDRAGFRRTNQTTGETEFLILRETFKSELCKGFSYLNVINELERSGFARCQRPATTIKTPLPGFQNDVHVFCIRAAILEGDSKC